MDMVRKLKSVINGLPKWITYGAIITGNFLFVALFFFLLLHDDKSQRVLSDLQLILFVVPAVLIIGILYYFCAGMKRKPVKNPVLWYGILYLLLFAVQAALVSQVYFFTGWDAGLLQFRVEGILEGKTITEVSADYGYSVYPNNLLLFYVSYLICKIGEVFSMERPYGLCIYVSCLMVTAACFLGCLIMRKLSKSMVIRTAYIIVSAIMILFSPWIMIPYSDTYGMFFVLLGLWGVVCPEKVYVKWPVVAFAAIIGYQIKPTCIFPLFAVLIIYGISWLVNIKKKWKELTILAVSMICMWLVSLAIPLWIQHTFSFRLIPEYEVPYTHYLMMGFNEEANGGYNHNDFLYSMSFPDVETRKAANIEEVRRRLEYYNASGKMKEFLERKALINFNDGTFAWAKEGAFFVGYIDHDNMLGDLFQEIFIPSGYIIEDSGAYYELYRTVMQGFWLFVILGILFVSINMKEYPTEKACMMIALCGLIVFLMLFEARARYLFLYTPVFVIFAMCGYEALFLLAAKRKLKNMG